MPIKIADERMLPAVSRLYYDSARDQLSGRYREDGNDGDLIFRNKDGRDVKNAWDVSMREVMDFVAMLNRLMAREGYELLRCEEKGGKIVYRRSHKHGTMEMTPPPELIKRLRRETPLVDK